MILNLGDFLCNSCSYTNNDAVGKMDSIEGITLKLLSLKILGIPHSRRSTSKTHKAKLEIFINQDITQENKSWNMLIAGRGAVNQPLHEIHKNNLNNT